VRCHGGAAKGGDGTHLVRHCASTPLSRLSALSALFDRCLAEPRFARPPAPSSPLELPPLRRAPRGSISPPTAPATSPPAVAASSSPRFRRCDELGENAPDAEAAKDSACRPP
jgi:hypothetical protein